MKTFKFNKFEHVYDARRTLIVDLLSDDNLTGITFSSSAFLVSYKCMVWSKNQALWEKKVKLNIEDQGTLGARGRDDITGLKLLIAACVPELMLSGYMPTGSFQYGDETIQLNPHDAPIEAIELPPDL